MSGLENLTAEISWMRRRGLAATPKSHPLRTASCPSLGVLARGSLSAEQNRHVAGCRHCRAVREAGSESTTFPARAAGALAAALAVGVWLAGWQQPQPARFAAPVAPVVEPAPKAVEAAWPAPLRLRAPGQSLPTPAPRLPVIRPLERFHPPQRSAEPVPVAVLGEPDPQRSIRRRRPTSLECWGFVCSSFSVNRLTKQDRRMSG